MHKQINLFGTRKVPVVYPFMHFLGASRDGLVARRVDLDTISSSDMGYVGQCLWQPWYIMLV
jgi:hypothetical protein